MTRALVLSALLLACEGIDPNQTLHSTAPIPTVVHVPSLASQPPPARWEPERDAGGGDR